MPLRMDFEPYIKSAVKKLYMFARNSRRWKPEETWHMPNELFCNKMLFFMNTDFHGSVIGLSLLYDRASNISALEEDLLNFIASSYRFPKPSLALMFKQSIVTHDKEVPVFLKSFRNNVHCLQMFKAANITMDAIIFSASIMFSSGLFESKHQVNLGTLLADGDTGKAKTLKILLAEGKTMVSKNAEEGQKVIKKFSNFFAQILKSTTKQSMSSLLLYLDYFWDDVDVDPSVLLGCPKINSIYTARRLPIAQLCSTNSTWPCCELEQDVSKNLALVWKAMKYIIAPPGMKVLEKGEKQDHKQISGSFEYKIGKRYLKNTYPTILACKFGDQPLDFNCDLFRKIFTTEGIGYTFNNEPFFKLFKNTSENRAFFKEIYETEYSDKDLPRKILSNGKQYSFEFILLINEKIKKVSRTHKVAIHDPHMVADTRYEAIDLEPGLSYEITITPTVTVTDDNGLQLDPKKRNCLSAVENESLELFHQYSQSACIFECQLKRAQDNCNCTPWNYPQQSGHVNLCWHYVAKNCFEEHMKITNFASCDCPNDCNSVYYSSSVQITPLKDRY